MNKRSHKHQKEDALRKLSSSDLMRSCPRERAESPGLPPQGHRHNTADVLLQGQICAKNISAPKGEKSKTSCCYKMGFISPPSAMLLNKEGFKLPFY